ncbi:MAG: pantetheine-phosphate adenylyltransferase [Terriglobia bacterium]
MAVSVYPGSFDPVTAGHIDIIRRARHLYDEVVIGVAEKPPKVPFFSLEERLDFLRESLASEEGVRVETFGGLAVEFCRKQGAQVIVRGLRAVSDFEHEFQMAQLNRRLAADVETVFIMASPDASYLSSSIIKEIARFGGPVSGLVPDQVDRVLSEKFGR